MIGVVTAPSLHCLEDTTLFVYDPDLLGIPATPRSVVNAKLTWDEIKQRYPNEWVALVEDDWPDNLPLPLSGIVSAHSPDHKTLIEMQRHLKDAAILWTGKTRGEALKVALCVDRSV